MNNFTVSYSSITFNKVFYYVVIQKTVRCFYCFIYFPLIYFREQLLYHWIRTNESIFIIKYNVSILFHFINCSDDIG